MKQAVYLIHFSSPLSHAQHYAGFVNAEKRGLGIDDAVAEFRPLRRDSLCPSGASLVSTMPAPSGDNGGAIR